MLNVNEMIKASKGKLINGKNTTIDKYIISSNDISEGMKNFFIPLKGEKSDGHKYIVSAVRDGIFGYFISSTYHNKEDIIKKTIMINKDIVIIEVEDTLNGLIDIAEYNRNKYLNTVTIGITGSVGKTSTREMIYSVLSQKYKVLKTIKNYNSEIGIPLMLLMNNGYEIAVYEMGMDGFGQLSKMTKLVKPDIAVITNIGTSHIGILGSRENIFKAKMEITEGLNPNGTLYLNKDNDFLKDVKSNTYKIVGYGIEKNADVEIVLSNENGTQFIYKNEKYIINETGLHHVYNAIVAIEIGKQLNMKYDDIYKGVANYRNFAQRMQQVLIKDNIMIIDDSYNASLDSMKSGLSAINSIERKRKIIVLGDMLELGEFSKDIHESLGNVLKEYKFEKIFLYGEDIKETYKIIKDKNVYYTNNINDLEKEILKNMRPDDLLYFKASNGMKLFNVINNIKNEY